MLALRIARNFCQMKYYKQIAAFLKIKVPIINEEIKINDDVTCVVHGIKMLEPDLALPLNQNPETVTTEAASEVQQQSSNATDPSTPPQPLYIYQQYSQEVLPFGKALSLSKTLSMDLNLMREGSPGIYPILSITAFRRHVYSQYFLGYVKRRGREGWKSVRLGERIEDNDIRTKLDNIQRMLKAGERRFKLEALNDSQRSQKVIIEFAKLLGKQVQPHIHTVTTAAKKKQERYVAYLVFDEEVHVDLQQVNKKWRRRQFEKEAKGHSAEELRKLFEDEDVRAERQLYNAYKDLNIRMPPRFQKLAQDERNLQNDRFALYRSAEEQVDEEQEWDEQEEQKFKQKMSRYNKEFFKERTATEIVEEMEELKRSGYESEAHKVARFKRLKEQLQAIIKKHQDSAI